MPNKKKAGFAVCISEEAKDFIESYLRLFEEGLIAESQFNFIQTVFDIAGEEPDGLCFQSQLAEIGGIPRSTALKRTRELINADVMTKGVLERVGQRNATLYTINDVSQFAGPDMALDKPKHQLPQLKTVEPNAPIQQELLSFERFQFPHKGESFVFFTLFSALPSANDDKKKSRGFIATINIGNEEVDLEVMPTEGIHPPNIRDMRTLAALVSLVMRKHDDEKVPEFCTLEFNDILRFMGKTLSGGNKRQILESLLRWYYTSFKILHITRGAKGFYGDTILIRSRFRVLSVLDDVSALTKEGVIPERIRISFDPKMRERLSEYHYILSLHPDFVKEQDPFLLKLHLWNRRACTAKRDGAPWREDHVIREVCPDWPKKKFRAKMKSLYEKYGENGVLASMGYKMMTVRSKEYGMCLVTSKNKSDPWLAGRNKPQLE